jgi:hypothetical protein
MDRQSVAPNGSFIVASVPSPPASMPAIPLFAENGLYDFIARDGPKKAELSGELGDL